jgi:hypothetical protein
MEEIMTEQEFYEYFNKVYCYTPLAAQMRAQASTIFHLKMEVAKLKKQVSNLSRSKEE